jgi:thymidine kinase
LLYDNQKKPFGATLPLSKLADKFIELFAKCDGCGKQANQSYRKTKARNQVILGAGESYGACCEACWSSLNQVK